MLGCVIAVSEFILEIDITGYHERKIYTYLSSMFTSCFPSRHGAQSRHLPSDGHPSIYTVSCLFTLDVPTIHHDPVSLIILGDTETSPFAHGSPTFIWMMCRHWFATAVCLPCKSRWHDFVRGIFCKLFIMIHIFVTQVVTPNWHTGLLICIHTLLALAIKAIILHISVTYYLP